MDIDELLKIAIESDASDLHIKAGNYPLIRVHGQLQALANFPRLSNENTRELVDQITNDFQKEALKTELDLDLAYSLLGIIVADLSFKKRSSYQTVAEEGVLIAEIHRQSYLARIGVRPGDVIRQIDDITITDTKGFKKAVIKCRLKSSVVITVQRGRYLYNLSVKL